MSLGWTAVQLRAMQARAQEAGKPSRYFNPKPLGSVQPGSKTALALRVLRDQVGNNTGGWVVYGDLLALMGQPDGRSIHWALGLLIRRGHIDVRVHNKRRFSYRITPEGSRVELVDARLIRDSGRRRATLGGDMAVVWEAC